MQSGVGSNPTQGSSSFLPWKEGVVLGEVDLFCFAFALLSLLLSLVFFNTVSLLFIRASLHP